LLGLPADGLDDVAIVVHFSLLTITIPCKDRKVKSREWIFIENYRKVLFLVLSP